MLLLSVITATARVALSVLIEALQVPWVELIAAA